MTTAKDPHAPGLGTLAATPRVGRSTLTSSDIANAIGPRSDAAPFTVGLALNIFVANYNTNNGSVSTMVTSLD